MEALKASWLLLLTFLNLTPERERGGDRIPGSHWWKWQPFSPIKMSNQRYPQWNQWSMWARRSWWSKKATTPSFLATWKLAVLPLRSTSLNELIFLNVWYFPISYFLPLRSTSHHFVVVFLILHLFFSDIIPCSFVNISHELIFLNFASFRVSSFI